MPLDRGWLTPLVDDSGSGTDGSIIDKQLFLDFADDIDAALLAAGGSGTPGGSTTQVQFNDAGAFGGDAGLVYDKTTDRLTSGLLTLSGGQIVFPATQMPSTDVNTLDDYEEGIWTGVIGGSTGTSGQTYTSRFCAYTKIGQLVMASYYLHLSTKGTISGNLQIQGLPFSVQNLTTNAVVWANLATTWTSISVGLATGGTVANVQGTTVPSSSSNNPLTSADVSNTTLLCGLYIYVTV